MRIALYVPSWPAGASANGIVTYAAHLVPALRRLGHEVYVLTGNKTVDDDDPYAIDLRKSPFVPTLWQRAQFKLSPETAIFVQSSGAIASAVRELVAEHAIDVLEIEESFGYSEAISRLNLLPVVVRLNGPWFLNGQFGDAGDEALSNRRREQREGRGIEQADFVTAPSADVLQAVKDHYGFALTASRVIPYPLDVGVDDGAWKVETCDTDSLLYVGRFDRRKGGDLVLQAFSELAPSYPKLKLTFVGPDTGIKQTDGTVWSFAEYVRRCLPESCRSRISFRGHKSHAEVMALRTKHFATVIASQYETMGYVVLEAMSLGCPLVATAVGGIPEMIKDQRNGLLVPSQDVKAMTAACRRLLDDRDLAARLGRQARLDCREFYGSETIAHQTIAAYQDAVNAFKKHGGGWPTSATRRRSGAQ